MSENPQDTGRLYSFEHASKFLEESARLDALHEATKAYFGGRLSLAPLEKSPPKSILEMGSGSGAWAIQAGNTYPDAEVLAVDLAEMPPQPLPRNVKFRVADLTKPYDFDPNTFDLVHARYTLVHVPHFEDALKRAIEILNPGGWLLLDDGDNALHDDVELGAAKEWFHLWSEALKTKKTDISAVLNYERILKASGAFSEISIHKFIVPISGKTDDPILKHLGETIRTALNSMYHQIAKRLADHGLTQELTERALSEVNDPGRNIGLDYYSIWARKHA